MASSPDGIPDFAVLFAVTPGLDKSPLTPRTAYVLYYALGCLADQAYEEVEEHGSAPVTPADADQFDLFARLPKLSWRQGRQWRRQMARAADDLAADLEAGNLPLPRCTAEELVLHMAIEDGGWLVNDQMPDDDTHAGLPVNTGDHAWDVCSDDLFQDNDALLLYDDRLDGVEDPDSDINRQLRAVDLRPESWFSWFANAEPRSTDRGFRR